MKSAPAGSSKEVLAGRYELGAVIGRGGMGVVRRGLDLRLRRTVAIKLLQPDHGASADVRNRFEDEARAAAQLSHPAAVTVFDSGEDGDVAYLVMECLPGRTLADELAEGPAAPERVHELAVDLLGALHAAHSLGILHRDVKPANVLITEQGRPKLADFGIAKLAEGADHTLTGLIIGTPAYLAPERLSGGVATPATDLYSLAVMLYEALTGEKPFSGDTPLAVAYSLQTATPAPIAERCPGIDRPLAEAIDRAMAREPSERFGSAAEMLDLLSSTTASTAETQTIPAANVTVSLAPPPPPDLTVAAPMPDRRWWAGLDRKRRAWLAGGACAVVVLLLVVAVSLAREPDAPAPSTSATGQPAPNGLPPALDDAIRQLEDAARP
jgi:serine/threonine protein kinase